MRLLNQHPDLSWRYTGYVAEHEETKKRAIIGGIALFLALYALLAIPFRSLYQPFFVMLAVPFGAIGALFGHIIMDITPSYLSIFGILALAGVVVNDSLVMVDFINQKTRAGEDLFESVIHSGTRRFRPIFLTSGNHLRRIVPDPFRPLAAGAVPHSDGRLAGIRHPVRHRHHALSDSFRLRRGGGNQRTAAPRMELVLETAAPRRWRRGNHFRSGPGNLSRKVKYFAG